MLSIVFQWVVQDGPFFAVALGSEKVSEAWWALAEFQLNLTGLISSSIDDSALK